MCYFLENKAGSVVVIVALIAFFSGIINVSTTKAAPDVVLSFSPATQSIAVGGNITLDAVVNPASHQVSSVSMRVTYDQTKLSLTGASCSATFGNKLYGPAIPSSQTGAYQLDCGVPQGNSGVTATSTVATFSFTALASVTNSPVAFTALSSAGSTDELGVNVLLTRNGATVTVSGAAVTYSNANFAQLATTWLQTGELPADVNNDNVVNTRDLGIMMSSWSATP